MFLSVYNSEYLSSLSALALYVSLDLDAYHTLGAPLDLDVSLDLDSSLDVDVSLGLISYFNP